jgi:transaldolase
MKIFLDTADVARIKKLMATGVIDGITTNPSNLSTAQGNPKEIILEICQLFPEGQMSVEVTEIDPEKVYAQAKNISALSKNIWVKIPCHERYYPIIKRLVDEKVKLNITLVFSVLQALMMCKLGVYYISPFIGRWEDLDVDGMQYIPEIRQIIDYYGFETKILAASIRTVQQMHEVLLAGVDAVTIAPDIFEKTITHHLTDQGIEKFAKDWAKLGVRQFP